MKDTRWPRNLSWAFAALLVVGIVQSALAREAFVAAHPFNVAWIAIAVALATATFFLHHLAPADRPRVSLAAAGRYVGLGGIGCIVAFALQGVLNPALTRLLGPGAPGLAGYLLLGLGAAVCQTAGKWGAIAGLHRLLGPTTPGDVLAIGLGVGLGFAGTEIVVIGQHTIGREAVLVPPAFWSLWERASAAGFHVFSGVLIAVGVAGGRRGLPWIAAVVAIHGVLDWLAGAAGGGLLPLSLPLLELIFLVVAIDTFFLSLLATRGFLGPKQGVRPLPSAEV